MYVTKTNFVYEQIRDAILTGKHHPNQKLILKELSQELDVSPMPVREAMNHLEKDGLVKKIPHRGYTVSPLSLGEMEELFALRIVLETFALESAVARIEEQSLKKLVDLTGEMRKYIEEHEKKTNPPSPESEQKKFMSINREFHLTIVSAAGYTHLPAILHNIFDKSERYMNLLEFVVGLDRSDLLDHQNIVQAIQNQESKKAERFIKEHIQRVLAELKQYVINHDWIPEGEHRLNNSHKMSL
jgi:DNA-binding GntR family transcriptional regulator